MGRLPWLACNNNHRVCAAPPPFYLPTLLALPSIFDGNVALSMCIEIHRRTHTRNSNAARSSSSPHPPPMFRLPCRRPLRSFALRCRWLQRHTNSLCNSSIIAFTHLSAYVSSLHILKPAAAHNRNRSLRGHDLLTSSLTRITPRDHPDEIRWRMKHVMRLRLRACAQMLTRNPDV